LHDRFAPWETGWCIARKETKGHRSIPVAAHATDSERVVLRVEPAPEASGLVDVVDIRSERVTQLPQQLLSDHGGAV
jgi:hypothetical protein